MVRISGGSRLLVMTVNALRWRSTGQFVEVVGLDRFEPVQGQVVEDEQVDAAVLLRAGQAFGTVGYRGRS